MQPALQWATAGPAPQLAVHDGLGFRFFFPPAVQGIRGRPFVSRLWGTVSIRKCVFINLSSCSIGESYRICQHMFFLSACRALGWAELFHRTEEVSIHGIRDCVDALVFRICCCLVGRLENTHFRFDPLTVILAVVWTEFHPFLETREHATSGSHIKRRRAILNVSWPHGLFEYLFQRGLQEVSIWRIIFGSKDTDSY